MIPAKSKTIYSINCGNSSLWDEPTSEFVSWANTQPSPYSLRYIGSMVADVHRFGWWWWWWCLLQSVQSYFFLVSYA